MTRKSLTFNALGEALGEIGRMVSLRLQEKGDGAYAGPHECYGIIAEEFEKELLDALHANDRQAFRKELLDIAVACAIGMASILPGDSSAEVKMVEDSK